MWERWEAALWLSGLSIRRHSMNVETVDFNKDLKSSWFRKRRYANRAAGALLVILRLMRWSIVCFLCRCRDRRWQVFRRIISAVLCVGRATM